MSLPTPNTRKEQYLNAIATGNSGGLPTPITREEEYLDAIAKSGGGGSGDGDMKKSVYDSDLAVANAGGISAFVGDAISGKVDKVEGKGLSTNDYDDTEKGKVADNTGAIEAIVNVTGAKNLANNDATTKTDSGVLFTVNADKSVTVQRQSPTTDPYSYIQLFNNKTLPATPLILSGCPNVTGLTLYLYDKTTSTRYSQTGDEIEVTPVAGHTYSFVIEALNSADLDTAVTVYPMLRDARITDPTYVPYAMTNKELTEICSDIPSELFKGFTGSTTRITDFNLLPNGVQAILTDTNTAHRPNADEGWVVFTCKGVSTYLFGFQLAISYDNNVFMRRVWNDWEAWIQLN